MHKLEGSLSGGKNLGSRKTKKQGQIKVRKESDSVLVRQKHEAQKRKTRLHKVRN